MSARAGRGLVTAAVIALMAALLAWLAAPLGSPFELSRHFTPHLSLAAGALALAAMLMGAPERAAAAGLAALVLGWAWLTVPFKAERAHAGPADLTVAVFNARHDPAALARGAAWAEREAVDVIMLAEAQDLRPSELRALFSAWPHARLSDAQMSAAGFQWRTRSAVFSRWPLEQTAFGSAAAARFNRPLLHLVIAHPDGAMELSALHPFPPILRRAARNQGELFDAVAGELSANQRFIIMGDLNTTVWSPIYARLPGLRAGDPRLISTFPAVPPVGGIAIDHILVGEALDVVDARVGPHLGSDHRPVIARLAFVED